MHPSGTPTRPAAAFSAAEVQSHLDRILTSEAFRSSRRSQEFLRFVVGRVLEGREDSIKERTIAVEVFGRPTHFDGSEDSFVRVKASEVRRRLAAYAEHHPEEDKLRIELPLGSYVPRFEPIEIRQPAAVTGAGTATRTAEWWRWLAVGALLFLAAGWLALGSLNRAPIDRLWAPILASHEPLVIFVPMPLAFRIVSEGELPDNPPAVQEIRNADGGRAFVVPAIDKVGLGATQGALRFAALCGRTGKAFTIKVGEDLTFADLRNQPAVLLGAFSSPWTTAMNNDLRFRLVQKGRGSVIDSERQGRKWTPAQLRPDGRPVDDYAIAARVLKAQSGQVVLIAAGVYSYGTQAAAEFLTDQQRIAELAKRWPQPLDRCNFQVVLHTTVIGNTPGPPQIVDAHFW
mgnify:CR=1 FL=1